MSSLLLIRDETPEGDRLHEFQLNIEGNYVSMREIIAARVMHEVFESQRQPIVFSPRLVEALPIHRFLPSISSSLQPKHIDLETQVFRALDAFNTHSYVVFINAVECKSLDQIVKIDKSVIISFIILIPLIG